MLVLIWLMVLGFEAFVDSCVPTMPAPLPITTTIAPTSVTTAGCTLCSRKSPVIDIESPAGMLASPFSTDVFSLNPSGCLVRSMICSQRSDGTQPQVSFNDEVLGGLTNAGDVKIALVCNDESQWVFSMNEASAVITSIGCYS